MIFGPTFIGMRTGTAPVTIDTDALAYKTNMVPGLGDIELSRLSRLFRVIKGEAIPGLQQLSKSYWDYLRGGWMLEAPYQTVTGIPTATMGNVESLKGDLPMQATGLTWSNYGTRFWNYDGTTNRSLRSTTWQLLQNDERYCFIVVGNFLQSNATQQYILAQNASGGPGRQVPLMVHTDGTIRSFCHNGTVGAEVTNGSAGFSNVPRTLMAYRNDTQLGIHLDGGTDLSGSVAQVPGTVDATYFHIGNYGLGGRSPIASTINMVLPFASADASCVFSGADFAKFHANLELIFRYGLKGTDNIRPLPNIRSYREMARVPSVTSGGPRMFGSPSLLEYPAGSGDFLGFHDEWGLGGTEGTMWVYSKAAGELTWTAIGSTTFQEWGRQWIDGTDIHTLGVTTDSYANFLNVRTSSDGGATWGTQTTLKNSAPFPNEGFATAGGIDPLEHNGRLYFAYEYLEATTGGYVNQGRPKSVVVISIAVGDDPHVAANWMLSNVVVVTDALRGTILGTAPDSDKNKETLEHVIWKHDGTILMMGRTISMGEIASQWSFDPGDGSTGGTLSCTGGNTTAIFGGCKFVVIYDEVSGMSIAVGNRRHVGLTSSDDRTALWLYYSSDGLTWVPAFELVDFGEQDLQESGWHYPDAKIIDDDLHLLIRQSFNGSRSAHDSTSIASTTVTNFRQHLP